MTDHKPLTAEEIAVEIMDLGTLHGTTPEQFQNLIKEALLSFSRQESASLVEALNIIRYKWKTCDDVCLIEISDIAEEALKTFSLNHPEKGES